mgnify:CR=1 FL=1
MGTAVRIAMISISMNLFGRLQQAGTAVRPDAVTSASRGPTGKGPFYLLAAAAAAVAVFVVLGIPGSWWVDSTPSIRAVVSAEDVLGFYYPKLHSSGVLDVTPGADDDAFDVLLLGASVLEQTTGRLKEQLQALVDRPVRLFDLSASVHTSRDSVFKLQAIENQRRAFDLIVVYHGINDARMNCCSPGTFRRDYSHCGWYVGLEKRLRAGSLMLSGTGGNIYTSSSPPSSNTSSTRHVLSLVSAQASR